MHATWHDDRPIGLYTVLSRRKGGACDSALLLHYWALCLIFVLWCNCLYYSHKIRFELKYHILYVNLFSSILSFNTSRVYRRFTGFFLSPPGAECGYWWWQWRESRGDVGRIGTTKAQQLNEPKTQAIQCQTSMILTDSDYDSKEGDLKGSSLFGLGNHSGWGVPIAMALGFAKWELTRRLLPKMTWLVDICSKFFAHFDHISYDWTFAMPHGNCTFHS